MSKILQEYLDQIEALNARLSSLFCSTSDFDDMRVKMLQDEIADLKYSVALMTAYVPAPTR